LSTALVSADRDLLVTLAIGFFLLLLLRTAVTTLRGVQWLNLLVETINRQLTADKLKVCFKTANALLLGTLGIVVVWLGARRVLDGLFSVGLLFAFISYKDQFLGRVSELTDKAATSPC
jgi:ABC-type bacteriocin/lantibiotic exporter with double-glycine peptidase domain